jgi:hypothetical protein
VNFYCNMSVGVEKTAIKPILDKFAAYDFLAVQK